MTITIVSSESKEEILLAEAASGQCFRVSDDPQIYMRSDEYDPDSLGEVICIAIPEGELIRWPDEIQIRPCYFAMKEA